jgi:CRISPR-associated protein Cas6/Cse3/CasE subtype I-E
MDIVIDKPAMLSGYALHRIVEQHQQGNPALWADEGAHLRIRPQDAVVPAYTQGHLLVFTVIACVALRDGRKHRYLPVSDWRGRRAWFDNEASKHGFQILGVHVKGAMRKVQTHDGRCFSLDATEFTGLLSVTDSQAFARCLQKGVGRVGKAFGLGMLIVR